MENNNINLEELSKILSTARMKKGYSQRKVARLINTHHSTYNELEKGNIKKPDIDMLRGLSEVLEISLEFLLTTAGYSDIIDSFKDTSRHKTPKNIKELVRQYRESQMDLLQDSSDKRTRVTECRTRLRSMMFKLEDYEYYKAIYPPEKILEEINSIYDDLLMSAEKYDYSKLPDDRIDL